MGLAEWLLIIKGVLAFPKEVSALIKLLRGTPAERHANILNKIRAEEADMAQTGRPKWDN